MGKMVPYPYTGGGRKKCGGAMALQKRKRYAAVDRKLCVGCGSCMKVCPKGAITVPKGIYAKVDESKCIGCGLCAKACPASVIVIAPAAMESEVQTDEGWKEMV